MLGQKLKADEIKVDGVWSSDLTRCKETTSIVMQYAGLQGIEPVYLSELRERSMGKLEGLKVSEAKALCEREGKGFHNYGEPRTAAAERLNMAFDGIVDKSLELNHDTVMIVSHGGVISKFVKHVVDNGFQFSSSIKDSDIKVPHNTSVTTILVDKADKSGLITGFGDASHLGDNIKEVDQHEK